ncbi:MAG: site-specific integrase [Actinobacteria bacterium]|nr:site-specific integrase [Actinomycetota bacterium]
MQRSANGGPKQDETTGTWGFVFDAGPGYDTGGNWRQRRQVRRRGFPTRKAARLELDRLRHDVHTGGLTLGPDPTVASWLTTWLDSLPGRLKPATVDFYRRTARLHIIPKVGDMRLSQVNAVVLNRLYSDKATAGLSAASVRHIHSVMSKSLGDAVKAGLIRVNPATSADPPSIKASGRRPMSTWTGEQVAAFLNAERDGRYGPLWTLLFLTGCRRGESLGLQWDAVDLEAGQVSIRRSIVMVGAQPIEQETVKTSRSRRSIRLQPELVASLKVQRKRQAADRLRIGAGWPDTGLVFTLADGSPLHPKHVSREYDRRLKRMGLPKIRLHDARHTYAVLALEAGVPLEVVSARLGHESIAITGDIYAHVVPRLEAHHADAVSALIVAAGWGDVTGT